MPELPEVETIRRDLEKLVIGQKIIKAEIVDSRIINGPPKSFSKNICGTMIKRIDRRSKALILILSKGFMVVQPKMTGQLIYGEKLFLKETKATFSLSSGKFLNYNDQRLFGKLTFTNNLEKISYFKSLGPEPLDHAFTVLWLNESLKRKKVPIKPLLMDQNFVAGIGNIYASEILYQSNISPHKRSDQLSQKEIDFLHRSTRQILEKAIKARGSSMRNYRDAFGDKGEFVNEMKVYGRFNEPCYNCQTPIQRIVQAGRSSFFCPKCQK